MLQRIKDAVWFIRNYAKFTDVSIWSVMLHNRRELHQFVKNQAEWRKLTPEQREAWYLTGEGRTLVLRKWDGCTQQTK